MPEVFQTPSQLICDTPVSRSWMPGQPGCCGSGVQNRRFWGVLPSECFSALASGLKGFCGEVVSVSFVL